MRRTTKLAPLFLGLPLALTMVGSAYAAGTSLTANLDELNRSGANGTAMVTVDGNSIDVTVQASGLVEGDAAPHAQHIHFGEEARHECPTMEEFAGDDDKMSTSEGAPAYGPVAVSLTTEGDTSADSTLAVERFPAGGTIEYDRDNIEVSADLAEAIARGEGVVVIHGVDYDDSGAYDGDEKSDLSEDLPREATDPALCGVLRVSASGGVDTGAGGGTSSTDLAMVALGGTLLFAAVGTGFVATKARS
ncbi:MAG TPA: CHRD domain-containing protein [Mycobacteriales bacterium]|jgi:hypothetical protein|nr:CHRD domain-containing protein [Mycobacteriales bacterium]